MRSICSEIENAKGNSDLNGVKKNDTKPINGSITHKYSSPKYEKRTIYEMI